MFEERHLYNFHMRNRLTMVEDLADVDEDTMELSIRGKTKNIERLESFSKLTKLWIHTVNQNELNTILSLVNPKMLYIEALRADDLSILGSLKDLEALGLNWNTKAQSLWNLSKNTSLKLLIILDFSKLNNLSELERSESLEFLGLSGGMWNPLRLDTLQPLRKLTSLKYLSLTSIKVKDESLEPLSELKGLKKLELSNQFPTEEFARLSVTLSNTECEYFKPYIIRRSGIGAEDTMVIGKRKPFLNSKVDMEKLQKYEKHFKAYQEKYRN